MKTTDSKSDFIKAGLDNPDPIIRRKALYAALSERRADLLEKIRVLAMNSRDEDLALLATQVYLSLESAPPIPEIDLEIEKACDQPQGGLAKITSKGWVYLATAGRKGLIMKILEKMDDYPPTPAIPFLSACLAHADPEIRAKSCRSAVPLLDPAIFTQVLTLTADNDEEVSQGAFDAIDAASSQQLHLVLERTYKLNDQEVNKALGPFLPHLARPELFEILTRFANRKERLFLSQKAAEALTKIQPPQPPPPSTTAKVTSQEHPVQAPAKSKGLPSPHAVRPDSKATTTTISSELPSPEKLLHVPTGEKPPDGRRASKPLVTATSLTSEAEAPRISPTPPEPVSEAKPAKSRFVIEEPVATKKPESRAPAKTPLPASASASAPAPATSAPPSPPATKTIPPKPADSQPVAVPPSPPSQTSSPTSPSLPPSPPPQPPKPAASQPVAPPPKAAPPKAPVPSMPAAPPGQMIFPKSPLVESVLSRYPSFLIKNYLLLFEAATPQAHWEHFKNTLNSLLAFLNLTFLQAYLFYAPRTLKLDQIARDCLKDNLCGEQAIRHLHHFAIAIQKVAGIDAFFTFALSRAMTQSSEENPLLPVREMYEFSLKPPENLEEILPDGVSTLSQVLVTFKCILQNRLVFKMAPGAREPYLDLTGPQSVPLPASEHPNIDLPPSEIIVLSKDRSEALGLSPFFTYDGKIVNWVKPTDAQYKSIIERLDLK